MNNSQSENTLQSIQTDDEISLIELWQILMRRKVVIGATMAAAIMLGIIYLILTPPVYEAKIKLFLPKANSIMVFQSGTEKDSKEVKHYLSLSRPANLLTQVDANKIFIAIQAELNLHENWSAFVKVSPTLFPNITHDMQSRQLDKLPISFRQDKEFSSEHIEVTCLGNDAKLSADILRGYLQFTREKYVTNLVAQVKSRIERQKENINADIALLQQQAKLKQADKIIHLRNDLALAKTLGVTDNQLLHSVDSSRGGVAIIASNEILPGYMRGTKALTAELNALIKRGIDYEYIDGLHEKQIELNRLNYLKISTDDFVPYSQDGEIQIPRNRLSPNIKITIASSIFIGLMLGIFAAIIADYVFKI